MKKIKVLIAAHIGQPWGGISSNYENLLASRLPELVELSFVETSARRSFDKGGYFNTHNLLLALAMAIRFFAALIKNNPNVIHIGTAHSGSFLKHSLMVLFGRLAGKKVILMLHCGYEALFSRSGFWRQYVLFILGRCNGIAVISREWLALKPLLPHSLIEYIPNALNLEPYLALPLSRFAGRSPVKLLYLGHIGRDKGTFDLIEAARLILQATLAPFQIDLVGDTLSTGEYERAQSKINENGLENYVYLWNAEFGDKKLKRLEQADVYVLPSYSEGMPISIIEALASALPVVGTRVGGIPDMIDPGHNGLLVSHCNPDELAQALIQLIIDAHLRYGMSCAARQIACERFSMENRVQKLVNLYALLLQSKR
jgi:glycosyltransferase involved in cell wall biosynthesis